VHPIFGAFLAGLIIPHDGGFAIALVEKIDDLVSMLFLPIVRLVNPMLDRAYLPCSSSILSSLVCRPT
jgi:hypothetical protein